MICAAVNCFTPEVEKALRDRRSANIASFETRVRAAMATGELPPPDMDPPALARFVGAVIQGMSQQARDGATRAELEGLAETAMRAWPS